MSFIFVYTTNRNKNEAKKISDHLIKKKLASCTNMFPMESSYRWKGKIVSEKETVLIIKAKKENWNKLKKEIKKIHSYTVPCIIKFNVSANREYEKWLKDV